MRVTLPRLVAYAAFLLAAANALGALLTLHASVALHVVAAVVALPSGRAWLASEIQLELSRWATIVVYLVTTVVGNVWLLTAL